jgi:hypothetical protein
MCTKVSVARLKKSISNIGLGLPKKGAVDANLTIDKRGKEIR